MNDGQTAQYINDMPRQAPQAGSDARFTLPDEYANAPGADSLESLGGMYQRYIAPQKDAAFEIISKGGRLEAGKMPAATQIFTPKWIALYMAQNSIGCAAYAIGAIDEGQFARLKAKWRYYIDGALPLCSASARGIETLTVFDPCVGTGNLLMAAFDVLFDIYAERGFNGTDAAKSILENNLSGIDIDDNAVRIAAFSLKVMARERGADGEARIIRACDEAGSLRRTDILNAQTEAGRALAERYDVVLCNPPYMGASNLPLALSRFIASDYPEGKADIFAAFIVRCRELTCPGGYTAIIAPHSWMFLKSFADLRRAILRAAIVNMLHLGSRAFDEITGEVVQTAAFVMKSAPYEGGEAVFVRLVEAKSGEAKEKEFFSGDGRYTARQDAFASIPGEPVAYWASPALIAAFAHSPLKSVAYPCQGLATADNGRFLRLWHEVPREDICFNAASRDEALESGKRWFPYNKGGKYRKWYGNDEYVVDWSQDGREIRSQRAASGKIKSRPQNLDKFFRPSVTWSKVSSNDIAFRFKPRGFIFDVAGTSMFADEETLMYLLAFCNSRVALEISRLISPTMNFEVGQIASFPVIIDQSAPEIAALARKCVAISKRDWDGFENSWDFKLHPMLEYHVTGGYGDGRSYAETSFGLWKIKTREMAYELKALEEEINRRFISIYGLEGTPYEVDIDSVCVRRVMDELPRGKRKSRFALDKREAAASLVSYAVGCAFSRFEPFGEGFGNPDRKILISACPRENDAVSALKEFLVRAYSPSTLTENLRFIALALSNGSDGTEKAIYGYFLKRFYADHLKTYKNRPIYRIESFDEFSALTYVF